MCKPYKVVLGLLLIVMLLGTSFALFSEVFIGKKNYSITSGNLKVYLDESRTNNITLTNVIPVSDDKGLENDPFVFSLVNEETEDLEYTIYLKEEELINKTPSSAIRYNYKRDIENIKVTRNLEELKTEDGRYYLETGIIPSKTTYNYEYRMWINYQAGNEIMGTEYSMKIEIEAVQAIKIYKEEILNGTDPILSENLVPVVIEDDGTVKKASLYKEWYSYSNQRWANAIVLEDNTKEYSSGDIIPESNIESYFVWIPRYKYKLFNMGEYTNLTNLSSAMVQVIEVVFENKDTVSSIGTKVGDYMSHPAFLAFDSNGFWVGKFESGYRGATSTAGAQQNTIDSSKLIIKPNVYSWRNITVGNMFKVSYDYLRSDESHMMKNTEWGAVAYLQHSKYGSRSSVRVNNNSSYLTGYAAVREPTCGPTTNNASSACNPMGTATSITQPYNTSTGYSASTTGNISGIYDMSGGAWEYVMGYNTKANSVGGSSGITNIYGDFLTNLEWEKYYDKYSNTTETVYTGRILGDATGEMGPFADIKTPSEITLHNSSWYNDYGYFVTATNPWVLRGGNWTDGLLTGVMAFSRTSGASRASDSFRVALTP